MPLRLSGPLSPRGVDWALLAAFDDRLTATLDCTGGWFAEPTASLIDRLS